MSVDLVGEQGHVVFNIWNWSKILTLAQQYGWQPMGTEAPGPLPELEGESPSENNDWRDWDGNYLTNDFQSVTAEDATNIAAALERVVEDIPDHDAMEDKVKFIQDQRVFDWDTACNASPVEWFSGRGKQAVQQFIAFCKAGEFCIS